MSGSVGVVVAGSTQRLAETLQSLAWAAEERVEVVVAWTGDVVPEAARRLGDRVLELLPIGTSYARNRGLAVTAADVVLFLEEGLGLDRSAAISARALRGAAAQVGGAVAFDGERLRAVGGFDHALHEPAATRDAYRRALGRRPSPLAEWRRRRARDARSPRALLEHAPPEIRELLDLARLEPWPAAHRTKTHYLFASPPRALLHVHVGVRDRLVRSLEEREAIRRDVDGSGIPALLATARSRDAVWVAEELVDGAPPAPADAERWFPRVADWLTALAGPPGPPLADDAHWADHVDTAVAAAPPEHRDGLRLAFDRVGTAPSRHMHGDLQPRNVLIGPGGVHAVDWEGAWLRGIPGLDLVYLGLLARGGGPDPDVIECLLRREDPPGLELVRPLERLGVGAELLPDALVAMLATWALGEQRRRARLGAPPTGATPFGRLLQTASAGALSR